MDTYCSVCAWKFWPSIHNSGPITILSSKWTSRSMYKLHYTTGLIVNCFLIYSGVFPFVVYIKSVGFLRYHILGVVHNLWANNIIIYRPCQLTVKRQTNRISTKSTSVTWGRVALPRVSCMLTDARTPAWLAQTRSIYATVGVITPSHSANGPWGQSGPRS